MSQTQREAELAKTKFVKMEQNLLDQITRCEKEKLEISNELVNSRREIVDFQRMAESFRLANFEMKRQIQEMNVHIGSLESSPQVVILKSP